MRLSASPILVLGEGATSSDELLDVISATKLSNGNVAIADRGAHEVRVYDRSGRIVGRSGRRGKGPGDFEGFSRMWRDPNDSLYVWDHAQGRVSVLGSTATYVRAWPRLDVSDWYFVSGRFADGSLLAELPITSSPPQRTGIVEREMYLARLAPENKTIDTLGRFLRAESIVIMRAGGVVSGSARIPVARSGHVAVYGNDFLFGDGTLAGVVRHDTHGKEIQTIASHQGRAIASVDERRTAMLQFVENARMPPAFRVALERSMEEILQRPMVVYDSVLTDGKGGIWLRDAADYSSPNRTWIIFNGDGSIRGRLSIPATLSILEIGPDFMLVKDESALGYSVVKEYKIISG